jgi:bifunctional ADP-heptose synthase (sugar kinase/adenylyltransferase)
LADDSASADICSRLRAAGVEVHAIPQRRQIVSKHRYLVDQSKLFKVDDGAVHPLDSKDEPVFADQILQSSAGADAVIFVDFGYGLLTAPLLQKIMPMLRRSVPILSADISGLSNNLLRFRDVDLICPTERELRQSLNDFSAGLTNVAYRLMAETRARQLLVTLGKEGLVAFDQFLPPTAEQSWERQLRSAYLPSLTSHAVDPLGCGDALLSAATLTLAAGGSLHAAGFLGSTAAALEAGKIGNHPISIDQILSRIHQYQEQPLAA